MKTWKRLPAVEGGNNPCLCCPPIEPLFDLERCIAVGFGAAGVSKDGETVWMEDGMADGEQELWQGTDAEKAAESDPDHDWQIYMHGPMHGEVYQRHGPKAWVLVKRDQGFA